MSSSAIRPTWAPFHSTLSVEERLKFSLRLMNGECRPGSPLSLQFLVLLAPAHVLRAHSYGLG